MLWAEIHTCTLHIYLSIFLSIHLYIYLSISLSIYIFVYLSIYVYSYLYTCPSIYPSIYIYLSIPIYIYIYMYISAYILKLKIDRAPLRSCGNKVHFYALIQDACSYKLSVRPNPTVRLKRPETPYNLGCRVWVGLGIKLDRAPFRCCHARVLERVAKRQFVPGHCGCQKWRPCLNAVLKRSTPSITLAWCGHKVHFHGNIVLIQDAFLNKF